MPEARTTAVTAAVRGAGDEGALRGDPVSDMLMDQLASPPAPPLGPDLPFVPIDLGPKPTAYRFRSKGRHRMLGFHIPVPADRDPDDDQKIKAELRGFKRRTKDHPNPAGEQKRLKNLAERLGSRMIFFTPVSRKFECFYNTNDVELAAWLRAHPDFDVTFYEEMGPIPFTLPSGETIQVVPKTDADRQALSRARAAQ